MGKHGTGLDAAVSIPCAIDMGINLAVDTQDDADRCAADELHPVGFGVRATQVDRWRMGAPTREDVLRESTPRPRHLTESLHPERVGRV